MTSPTGMPSGSGIRRWAGLTDPTPGRGRAASAALIALLLAAMTIVGVDIPSLGSGAGRLFFIFAIVVGPGVAALLVLRPWSGLVAWAAMMPLLNVARLQVWVGPVQLTDSTVFVVAFAIGILLDRAARRSGAVSADPAGTAVEAPAWPRTASLVAAGLIAFPMLSLLASPALASGIPIVLHGVIEPVLVGLLVLVARPTPRRSLLLGGALVAGLAFSTVYSVARLGRLATTLAEFETLRVDLARLTFYNVGIFGDVLAMVIPLGVAWLLWRRPLRLGRAGSLAVLVMLAILVGGLYLTFSKSAWLGTWLAVTAVAIARFRRPRQIAGVVVGAGLALMLIVPYPVYVLDALHIDSALYQDVIGGVQGSRLSSWDVGSPDGEVSIGERWRATMAAVRMTVDHPLLGVGPGRFAEEYRGPYADPGATRHLVSPHDLLPDVASELGLPAALLLFASFIAALWAAWRAVRSDDIRLQAAAGAFGASLAAFLAVTATFGLDLYRDYRVMNSDVIVGALVVGVCLALGTRATRSTGTSPSEMA